MLNIGAHMDAVTGIHIEVHGFSFVFFPCLAASLIQRIFIWILQESGYYDFLSTPSVPKYVFIEISTCDYIQQNEWTYTLKYSKMNEPTL